MSERKGRGPILIQPVEVIHTASGDGTVLRVSGETDEDITSGMEELNQMGVLNAFPLDSKRGRSFVSKWGSGSMWGSGQANNLRRPPKDPQNN